MCVLVYMCVGLFSLLGLGVYVLSCVFAYVRVYFVRCVYLCMCLFMLVFISVLNYWFIGVLVYWCIGLLVCCCVYLINCLRVYLFTGPCLYGFVLCIGGMCLLSYVYLLI